MATVDKNFRVKNGLVVEGSTATVDGHDILTEGLVDAKGDLLVASGADAVTRLAAGTDNYVLTADSSAENGIAWKAPAAVGEFGSSIVFEGSTSDGHETTLQVVDPTSDRTITLPNATGTVTLNDATQTLSNKTISYTDNTITVQVANVSDLTANASELNTLDGITASTAELNILDGVTASASELNVLDGITASTAELNILDGVTAAAAELNILDGATLSTTELNYVDGVTSAIQTQLDGKALATDLTNHESDTSTHGVTGAIVGTTDTQTISNKTLGSDLHAGSYKITNLATPTSSTDAATKAYVDAVTEGLHIHASAVAATTANINISTGLEVGDTIDGIILAAGDRVLVKNQNTASENGIWVVQASGAAVRALDFDQPAEVDGGDFIFVTGGTVNEATGWVQTSDGVATIGTDPIYFTQFSGAGTYAAGNGLTLVGNEFSIDTTITAEVSYVDFEIGDHADDTTGVHGVTGTIVGTSDSQTLTNKTISLSNNTVSGTLAEFNSAVTDANIASLAGIETLTNKTISGADNTITNIANASLTNDSVTINSNSVDLGGSLTLDTDDIGEGTTNKYFTDNRAKDAAGYILENATQTNISITYDEGTHTLSVTAENGVGDSTTDDLDEGSVNLYYTDARARGAVSGGTGLDYNSGTGVFDIDSTVTTNSGSQTLTNKTISGSSNTISNIGNGSLTNSSVTINTNSLSLGGSLTLDTDDIAEGTTNKYFSNAQVYDAISTQLVEGSNIDLQTDNIADTVTVNLVDDVVIPTTGSLEVESNDFNVGVASVGLRTSDEYTNPIAVFSIDADDDYAQLVVKNTGNGVNASTDIIAYANNGDDSTGWIDMGITSASFNDPSFTITGGHDGYIFMEAPAGTSGNGDLVIATGSEGAENRIVFAAGGLSSDNTQMTITPDESVRIVIPTASTSPTTGALVVEGGVGIQGDVNIQGTITFGGAGTTVETDNLAVTDPMIYVGNGNTTDAVDMGLITEYTESATTKFAGVVRDATDGVFKFFEDATTRPTSTVNFAEAGLAYGDVKVDNIEAASGTFTNITIGGVVDQTEIGYLNGVTSSIQNQLDGKLDESGGTMTGAIAMGTNKITGLGDPTSNQDAATKAYVDSQDTDDVAEGSTNLYFTDNRARLAVDGTDRSFTSVEVNDVAKQVAASQAVTTVSTVTAYSWAKATYRSAKFLVKFETSTHSEVSEVLLTLDGSDNVAITEYAIVTTNGSLGDVTADVSGTDVRLRVTTSYNNTDVMVVGTLLV